MKNISKKALIFSILLTFAILLSACQSPAATTEAKTTAQVTPSSITASPVGGLSTISPMQKLRITNQSNIPFYNLVVRFPDERIEFGDVPGGTTTEYREISQGVYRYAAYDVEVNGQKYQQSVVDWIGETPCRGSHLPTSSRWTLRVGKRRVR